MTNQVSRFPRILAAVLWAGALLTVPVVHAQTSGASQLATWNCTGDPCPWGPSDSGQALVWPQSANPLHNRFGYTVSAGVYLPSGEANGTIVKITSGSASLYAGLPDAGSHRGLATLSVGDSYEVTDLASGEVLSVQSGSNFAYQFTKATTPPPEEPTDPLPGGPASQLVTWNCTGAPCPWGDSTSGQALVWPDSANPVHNRFGYTVSKGIYLPAAVANGTVIWINGGSASLYAGTPDGSHRALASLSVGEFYEVSGLAAGEVLSVQGDAAFVYQIALPAPQTEDPEDPIPNDNESHLATWSCTGDPCPWGSSTQGQALVWPDAANPVRNRFGYTVDKGVYLPAAAANGTRIWIDSGSAGIYAGTPDGSHRALVTISAGETYEVSGLAAGEVLSVQSSDTFTFRLGTAGTPPDEEEPPPGEEPPGEEPPGEENPPGDDALHSKAAYWRCNTPGCNAGDWIGAVISWPSATAYSSNNRTGEASRTVYSAAGQVLHPYMGSWADGCKVTARSGTVLIIEWERGSDVWRETYLNPGEAHVIDLVGSENGAMIETYDFGPAFSVDVENCTAQPLP